MIDPHLAQLCGHGRCVSDPVTMLMHGLFARSGRLLS
jgi:hypothetical protein